MKYYVELTERALEDLESIYEYIAFMLLEPAIAENVANRITDALQTLEENPKRYPIYQEEPWKSRELRRIIIGNYNGYYIVDEKFVHVVRISYGGRDIVTILDGIEDLE